MPTSPGAVRGTIPNPANVLCRACCRTSSANSTMKRMETISALACNASLNVLKCDPGMLIQTVISAEGSEEDRQKGHGEPLSFFRTHWDHELQDAQLVHFQARHLA